MTVTMSVSFSLAEARRRPAQPARTRADAVNRLVPVGLLLGLLSHYPGSIFRRSSLNQYFTGVYRSRALACELILGIANGIDGLFGVKGVGPSPGFAVGWVTVTGGRFLAAWWLLRGHVRARAAALGPVEVFLVVIMAASAAVLTPYDFLSYALIIATVVAAGSGQTIATAALATAAVATRESGLLVVAVIVASGAARDGEARLRHRQSDHRATLARYSPAYLRDLRSMSSSLTIAAYCLWAFDKARTAEQAGVWFELSVAPFVLAILRYSMILDSGGGGAPEDVVLGDRTLQVIGLAWLVLFGLGLYSG